MPTPKQAYNKGYAILIARTLDILCATWLWRDYDITISSICGLQLRRARPAWWAIVLGRWFLNHIEAHHCELAIAADSVRAQEALRILLGTEPV